MHGKTKDIIIKESLVELKKLRRSQKSFKLEKRVLWLSSLKENKFKTRTELCEYLNINLRTQQKMFKVIQRERYYTLIDGPAQTEKVQDHNTRNP